MTAMTPKMTARQDRIFKGFYTGEKVRGLVNAYVFPFEIFLDCFEFKGLDKLEKIFYNYNKRKMEGIKNEV